jgi:hypothetical protein
VIPFFRSSTSMWISSRKRGLKFSANFRFSEMLHGFKFSANFTFHRFWNSSSSKVISSHNLVLEEQPKEKNLNPRWNFEFPNSKKIIKER